MSNLDDGTADLLATVEEIRTNKYPSLDPDLVSEILEVQLRFAEDRAEARKRTEQIVNRWATRQPAPKEKG
ncbi:hypothetical protein [Streptomyces scabiei]|uniref:hypothetical protein n=1 Tax=Streptomyces scabiei TaxID=1930 RepID=UPI001B335EA1|nr:MULTISPECIES: hypothetical protein [Streptomyces]MBP5891024.1 hypothetical protein [Streptomyces sp. LBUM 1481]MBP5921169.1 hypothetical protein [Streptomyces sp. LBUM 1483]MDX2688620.1 hypothetical protein [Streptomyces scabiei]MDX2753776.1 hypothetical protein [Streptomyces scabiei]MDX2808190.1 hypothetical protein [Streptomyces scabiei]